ncbi:ABC transporter permease [Candidatus Gracilibacteria bacterium]|nr:ABC transporter permease [Candidatus Gracilibacteria bacterium]
MKKPCQNSFEILKMFIRMDFILRYQNSVLGFLWVFLKPFLIFLVLLTVFTFFGGDIQHYQVYLLLGIILFQFFSDGTTFGMHSILNKAHVILKIPFSKTSVILAGTLNALLHFFFALLIFFGFLFFNGLYPSFLNILLFLLLIFIEFLFILGLSFFTSLWVISFRDLGQIWEVFLTALFYLVPIFYPLSILPEHLQKILWFNPLSQIIVFSRDLLIYGKTVPSANILYLFIGSSLFCFLGWRYFQNKIQSFTEKI